MNNFVARSLIYILESKSTSRYGISKNNRQNRLVISVSLYPPFQSNATSFVLTLTKLNHSLVYNDLILILLNSLAKQLN